MSSTSPGSGPSCRARARTIAWYRSTSRRNATGSPPRASRNQVAVGDVCAHGVPASGQATRRSGLRSAIRPGPFSAMPNRMRSASAGIRAVIACPVQWVRSAMVRPRSSRVPSPRHPCLRTSKRSPPCAVRRSSADLAAEGDVGAAVVVGVDGLDEDGGPAGSRDGGGQDRGRALGGGRVVRLPVRPILAGAWPGVQVPPVQAFGEVQVARLVARPPVQRRQRPARRRGARRGPGGGRSRHRVGPA